MFDLKGRYGTAKVFASIVNDETIGQIMGVLNTPLAENSRISIMADCHAGSGCVVGTTMQVVDKVCPNLVGVDIGCGMLTINLGKIELTKEDLHRFDVACHNVPSGFSTHKEVPVNLWKISFGKRYGYKSCMESFFKEFRCYNKLADMPRLERSLGSLGGGNHFIELDQDSQGNYYMVIHSGSRNLGKQIADYYQDIAVKKNKKLDINEMIAELKSQGKEVDDKLVKDYKKNTPYIPKELSYLTADDLKDYLYDINVCQEWASWNRKMIATQILQSFYKFKGDISWDGECVSCKEFKLSYFETIHNYIDIKHNILRKGAVSAQKDEILLIPINMRDGSLICRGLGNEEYNYSAPHGAGRVLSRSEAKELVSVDDYKETMKGVYSTTVDYGTIDESPFVYKPIEAILDNIKDTVEVIDIIKPIYNFKATGEEIFE